MIGWSLAATGVIRNGVLKTVLWIECSPHLQKKTVSSSLMSSSNDLTLPREKFPSTIAHSPKNLCSSVPQNLFCYIMNGAVYKTGFPNKVCNLPLGQGRQFIHFTSHRAITLHIHSQWVLGLLTEVYCLSRSIKPKSFTGACTLWREYQ